MEDEAKTDRYGMDDVEVGKYLFWCTKSAVQPILNEKAAKSNFDKALFPAQNHTAAPPYGLQDSARPQQSGTAAVRERDNPLKQQSTPT